MKLWAMLPELILAGTLLGLVPAAGWVRGTARKLPGVLASVALLTAILLTARMLRWEPIVAMHGTYAVDGFAHIFKLIILVMALLVLVGNQAYFRGSDSQAHAPVALLFGTLGATALCSSIDLALVALFVQMTSMGTYVLVALVRSDWRALEAGIKLFLYGAAALAVMAYGLTFFYGQTGSLDLRAIGTVANLADPRWLAFGFVLILVGLAFEASLVPFHTWAPDVYEGATAPVSAFLSTVPKIAALAVLARLVIHALPDGAGGWPLLLAAMAAITMTFGNVAALVQTRLKRLLAYSSIAQAGYMAMALVVVPDVHTSPAALAYYAAAYGFANIGAFVVAARLERSLGVDSLRALRGLVHRNPGAAWALAACMLSLAGFPPLAGFVGKVLVLQVALEGGLEWLSIVAVVNMAIGLYYYARVAMSAVLREPQEFAKLPPGLGFTLPTALCITVLLVLGIFPGPFIELFSLSWHFVQ